MGKNILFGGVVASGVTSGNTNGMSPYKSSMCGCYDNLVCSSYYHASGLILSNGYFGCKFLTGFKTINTSVYCFSTLPALGRGNKNNNNNNNNNNNDNNNYNNNNNINTNIINSGLNNPVSLDESLKLSAVYSVEPWKHNVKNKYVRMPISFMGIFFSCLSNYNMFLEVIRLNINTNVSFKVYILYKFENEVYKSYLSQHL